MREVNKDETLMRRFLLGELDEAEQQGIEGLFMSDREYREDLLMAENDLIEDYLEGTLSAGQRDRFLAHFLSTPQQRRKLRIAKSIKKYATVELAAQTPSAVNEEPVLHVPRRRSYFNALRLRNPFIYLPVAAALIITIVLSLIWLAEQRRLNNLRADEQSRRLAVERELAQFNDPSGLGQPHLGTQVFSVVLSPISVRGVGSPAKLYPPANSAVIDLWLVLLSDEYQSYRAMLRKVGSADQFTIPDLRAEDSPNGKAVRVRIPAHLLTSGSYELVLHGITADSKIEEVGDYNFMMGDLTTR